MKRLFVLIWTAIVLLTGAGCLLIYAGNNGGLSSAHVQNTQTVQEPSQLPLELRNSPATLPVVAPTQRSSRYSGEQAGTGVDESLLKSDYIEPVGIVSGAVGEDETGIQSDEQAGAQYDFDEEMYIYRTFLTENQKKAYDAVYSAAMARLESCNVSSCALSAEGLDNVIKAVQNDHPELFWMDTSQYKYTQSSSGRIVGVSLEYNATAADIESAVENFRRETEKIVQGALALSTDEEKEKYVHDALAQSVTYDESALLNQSAYSAIVNKSSVCAGYARAFQYIMQQLDIPCYYCAGYGNSGTSVGSHAWNIVKLGGKYCNVDVTWDDSLGEAQGKVEYTYYNKTDTEYAASHTRRDLSVRLPECQ
jgi:hypothetical protein